MIFCDNPRANEPAFTADAGDSPANRIYNASTRGTTAKYAILKWATHPPALWKDEVEHHLRKNGDKILQTVEQWAKEARNTPSPHDNAFGVRDMLLQNPASQVDIATELPALQKALQKYGATFIPERIAPAATQQPSYGDARGSSFGGGGAYGRGGYCGSPGSRFCRGFGRGY